MAGCYTSLTVSIYTFLDIPILDSWSRPGGEQGLAVIEVWRPCKVVVPCVFVGRGLNTLTAHRKRRDRNSEALAHRQVLPFSVLYSVHCLGMLAAVPSARALASPCLRSSKGLGYEMRARFGERTARARKHESTKAGGPWRIASRP